MTRIFVKTHVRAVLVAFAALLGAGQLAAEPIVIDEETGEQIRINGLSDGAMETLRGGGRVIATTPGGRVVLKGEVFRPGIWTDPDGCQHWIMDDGIEGYMAPILTREGKPVCHRGYISREGQFVIRKSDLPPGSAER
ncbi:hypothetical protein [Allosediminivita pacifica]|uniref:Uncharacterized protein n=1 Tax=Allosediminivita pacifica TaxID=1267769 RepID=A0A2T6B7X4_9RHOB|nr:hypothetical protein C8N44_102201 [Allosediminivita pacifica]GGA96700.1 hypothetical protein GCM10011324_03730 [Allosediminivita pacifica]